MTWTKKCTQISSPNYIVKKDKSTSDNLKEIVNEFNNFFFLFTKDQISQILKPYLVNKVDFLHWNSHLMFRGGVCESDVVEAVKRFKEKASNDCNMIDMSLIKKGTDCVLKLFTYICNKSFLSGILTGWRKMAKVVKICKNHTKYIVSHYRPVSLLPQCFKISKNNIIIFVNRLDNLKIELKNGLEFDKQM